jgi:deazaflavin-dependent oxidoreductase (nitroreductase family)
MKSLLNPQLALRQGARSGRVVDMDRPAVEDSRPPSAVLKFVNPVVIGVLRSSVHRLASKNLMLLTVTGRKSGRSYTMPVTRHEEADGTLVVSSAGGWRHNLRDGTDVRVVLEGQERTAHVAVEHDPVRAAEVFKRLLARTGQKAVGVKVNVQHTPTLEEVEPLLEHRVIAYLTVEGR